MNAKTIAAWVALGVLILFVGINWTMVLINFVWIVEVRAPLPLLMLISAAVGFAISRVWRRSPPKS